MTAERLPNWLRKRAELSPDRVAVEFDNRSYTFDELNKMAEETARKLASKGIRYGDICAVLMRNHIDSVVMLHALFYLGVKIVMLNNRLTPNELTWQIIDSQSEWFISEEHFSKKLKQIDKGLSGVKILKKEEIRLFTGMDEARIQEEFILQETATIMYTSGTSGNPKGVIQTFGNHWWSAMGSVLNLGLTEEDCWFCGVPIFHISGLSIFMRNVIYGMKVILVEKFDETEVNAMIQQKGVTIISVVTAMLNRVLLDLGNNSYPDSFRCMLLGGGPAPRHLLDECKSKGIPVYQTYGMTETSSQIVTLAPEYSMTKIGSAGKPLFPSQLKIEVEGRKAMPDEPGEIVVSGPNVTMGYLNREEETEKAIKNGWLYTGDIGYLDSEGFLYVMDRRSDLFISGGENVYPAEIESIISQHPAVFEAGVTSTDDEKWGQVPVAFVVVHEDTETDEKELISYCKQHLAAYKVPGQIIFCSSLPRNSSNKLLRRELKKSLGARK
ncbi:o-succinylbenzoate--CoA ligase [Peribacillus cavernae]|uniref:2-succinylbenzoate--CoA ligase n=1 Tax=Peribacillus cavernae TaxID=1674310 RepID=A0A433HUT3_9BACI|nr:o-succinylbenzoate--CoA ligase [Peribacillus cavernae]RUQ31995.1 o-succinylbenzoate--CoA ligase [Peribacillus cavernae]